jgi:hypothetical protein
MPTHVDGCSCRFCAALAGRVQTTEAWAEAHADHAIAALQGFTVEDGRHPSGEWRRLRCPCGSSLLTDVAHVEALGLSAEVQQ